MPFCVKCGSQHPEDATFCPSCGANVRPAYERADANETSSARNPSRRRGMTGEILARSFTFLRRKPFLLWGLSLLNSLLCFLAAVLGFTPLITLPICFVLQLGMASIYLGGYRGNEISSANLFSGFNKNFFRNAGGMAWMYLWILIWSLVPIAGMVLGIMKAYSYRFVPYIMLGDPQITATQALNKSMELTKGYKGKMFCADLLIYAALCAATLVLMLLVAIPVAGIVFFVILVLFWVVAAALLPLLMGIVQSAFYDEITK